MVNNSPNLIQLAIIGGAHGIDGAVKVKSFTADPADFGSYGPLQSRDGRLFTVAAIRTARNGLIVRFEEVENRDGAERLSGTELFVDRSALPDDLDDDEYYHADLIGLDVRDFDGGPLGKVAAIHDFGAGEIVEIDSGSGARMMIPFSMAAIPEIHLGQGFIVVDRHAAGLTDAGSKTET